MRSASACTSRGMTAPFDPVQTPDRIDIVVPARRFIVHVPAFCFNYPKCRPEVFAGGPSESKYCSST